jgi:hypothetical protein
MKASLPSPGCVEDGIESRDDEGELEMKIVFWGILKKGSRKSGLSVLFLVCEVLYQLMRWCAANPLLLLMLERFLMKPNTPFPSPALPFPSLPSLYKALAIPFPSINIYLPYSTKATARAEKSRGQE